MQGFFKLISNVIRLTLILVILAAIFHTWVIKQVIVFSTSYQLGADVSIREIKMDWKNTGFEVHGLEISNPYKFPRGLLADIPLAIVSVDIPALLQGRGFRIKTLGLNLQELLVVNIPPKGLNVLALKPLEELGNEKSFSDTDLLDHSTGKRALQLTMDELIISMGDILYIDMSGPTVQQKRFHVKIQGATYYDIRGAENIVMIIIRETLKRIGLEYLEARLQKVQNRISITSK